jgi:hypothetical protein
MLDHQPYRLFKQIGIFLLTGLPQGLHHGYRDGRGLVLRHGAHELMDAGLICLIQFVGYAVEHHQLGVV